MIESDNEVNESPNHGTPFANLDSDARSILSELENNKDQIGHGSFGKVYKSEYVTENNERIEVAVKKISIRNSEGFPLSAIREITILKKYCHPNIVKLIDIFVDKPKPNKKGNVSLVYEYAQHDLAGVKFIHDNYILHRDIKPANILITNKGEVKLADFGLSRYYEKRKNKWKAYTNPVETLWYRSPELLMSECYYKTPIDLWSVGCVMAELFIKKPLFKEQNVANQIKTILHFIGRPSEVELIRYYKINEGGNLEFIQSILPEEGEYSDFEGNLQSLDKTGYLTKNSPAMNLIKGLLTFNINKRLTADQALEHEFFKGISDGPTLRDPLNKKLQSEPFKNKEFHGEKVIFVKKNEGVIIKEAKNNSVNNEHYYTSRPPKKKAHIAKKINEYVLEEDKMEVEPQAQNEQVQNWNSLDDFI